MDAVGGLLTGFGVILTPENLYLCFLGSLIGTLVGVLPGVGPLAALALLLPITFTLTPVGGMVMLASIFYGAMYGGSTTSILLNIPGEAASVVTCFDGHQMAKQGRAGAALGIAAIGSFVAGTLGVIVMTFFAPAIAAVAIRFGPPENFALMVLGVICTLYMIAGSSVKGVLMVALGFLTAAIGIDVVNGRERFTFGSVDLSAGIELLAVVIGLFGVTEVLSNVERIVKSTVVTDRIRGLWPTLADWRASWRPMLRGSGLGFVLGLVPGGGPVTASFMSYALEKRISAAPRAIWKRRHRRRCRSGIGQQRRRRRQHHPGPFARHPGQSGDRAAARRPGDPGHPARPTVHHPTSRPVLGDRRQHVCRQRVPAAAQSSVGRAVGPALAHSLSRAVSDRAPALRGGHLFGEQERLRPVGHARLRTRWAMCCTSWSTTLRHSSSPWCSRRCSSSPCVNRWRCRPTAL